GYVAFSARFSILSNMLGRHEGLRQRDQATGLRDLLASMSSSFMASISLSTCNKSWLPTSFAAWLSATNHSFREYRAEPLATNKKNRNHRTRNTTRKTSPAKEPL